MLKSAFNRSDWPVMPALLILGLLLGGSLSLTGCAPARQKPELPDLEELQDQEWEDSAYTSDPELAYEGDEEYEEEIPEGERIPSAMLTVYQSFGGHQTYVSLYVSFPPEKAPSLVEPFQQVFGGKIGKVHERVQKYSIHLSARGDRLLQRSGLVNQFQFDLNPLVTACRTIKLKTLNVYLSHKPINFSEAKGLEVRQVSPYIMAYQKEFNLETPSGLIPPIQLRFGYRVWDVLKVVIPLILLVFLPIGFVLWSLRKAKQVTEHLPRAGAELQRLVEWTMAGYWLIWLSVLDSVIDRNLISFLTGRPRNDTLMVVITLVGPPLLVELCCKLITIPFVSRMRQLQASRREIITLAIVKSIFSFVTWAGLGITLSSLIAQKYLWALMAVSGTLVFWFIGQLVLNSLKRLKQVVLTPGDLRNRVFELATQAGVKVKEIFILSSPKEPLINAFAVAGGNVLLSEDLVSRLNRREVDAIVAHELGHLKHKHPNYLVTGLMLAVVASVYIGSFIKLSGPLAGAQGIVRPVVLLVCLMGYFYLSRRFEFTADAEAVELTKDPQAMITALKEITRHNLMPLEWNQFGEKLLTHPSTRKRAEAIAWKGGIPREHLQALLAESAAEPDNRYELPEVFHAETNEPANLIFSSSLRKQKSRRVLWIQLGIIWGLPMLIGGIVTYRDLAWTSVFPIYLISLVVIPLFFGVALNRLALSRYPHMARLLAQRFNTENKDWHTPRGTFVGLSPSADRQIYDGDYSWDIGFVFLTEERLIYVGERTRFALRRDQIGAIKFHPTQFPWHSSDPVYITWYDPEQDQGGTFSVTTLNASSYTEVNQKVALFGAQLTQWHQLPASATHSSELFPDLGVPQIAPVVGIQATQIEPRGVIAILALNFLLMLVVCYPTGLDFLGETNAAGWFVALASSLSWLTLFGPVLIANRRKRKSES
ncbi:MAG TPA: M48 family metalloprotease [Acidobacteriota bacterium]|nr:M48 family metalloprotease [Acidobacteriota bacterium]